MIYTLLLSALTLFPVSADSIYQNINEHYYNDSEQVVDWYEQGLNTNLSVDSTVWMHTNVVRSYYYQGKYDAALSVFEKEVMPFIDKVNDENTQYNAMALHAQVLHLVDKYDKSDSVFTSTINMITQGYDSVKSSAYINYSVLAWDMGDYQKYKSLTDSAYKYALKANDLRRQRITLLHLSEYHEKITYNFEDSKEYLEKASALYLNDQVQKESIIRLKIRQAEHYRDVEGDYGEAIKMFRLSKSEASSLGYHEMQKIANIGFMRAQYLYDQYQQERFRNIVIILLIGILITIALMYYTRKTRKVSNDYKKQFEDRINNI